MNLLVFASFLWIPSFTLNQGMLFCLLIQRYKEAKVVKWYSKFQFKWIIIVSPDGRISPSGTKTSKPAECKAVWIGVCWWVSRSNTEWCHSHFQPLIPIYLNPGPQRNSPIYWTLIQNKNSLLENLAPALQSILLALSCVVAESSKGYFLSSQLISDGREYGKNCMSMGLLPHFFWSEFLDKQQCHVECHDDEWGIL